VPGPAASPLIEVTGMGRRFGTMPPVEALRGIDLRVNRGEWLTIVGPSGSGKSTLLHILGCLDRQTYGTYAFDGIDVAGLSDGERAGLRGRRIGFVFQAYYLLSHRTVIENVMMADLYRRAPSAGRRARALDALAGVHLSHRADFLPTRLSGGERQRAAIARALMARPEVLLCDEPTGNLDSVTSDAVLDVLEELNADGLTIVMITHDLDVASRAKRRVRIVDGRLTGAS
jgi:ABC-type lipoprotein export system ATPase subunit